MKTIIEKSIIPEKTIEKTIYGCDVCDFTSGSKDEVEKHYGEKHACKEKKNINGEYFVYFDTKENMNYWARSECCDKGYDGWDGPYPYMPWWEEEGWYKISNRRDNCSCGCGKQRYIMILTYIDRIISDLEISIREDQEFLEDIRKEFNIPKEKEEY